MSYVQMKIQKICSFLFLLFFKKVAIRYSLNFKAIRLCANVECFTKLQIEKHTLERPRNQSLAIFAAQFASYAQNIRNLN